MPKPKPATPPLGKCIGGYSFGCRTDEHPYGKLRNIYCMVCRARMGCSLCVQPADELACKQCHQWATVVALRQHGPMVEADKVLDKVREIVSGAALLEEVPF
jgi:hypothetical protein